MLDPRVVRIDLEVDGVVSSYSDLAIEAAGSKYASPTQNEALVRICNLPKEARDALLTNASPFVSDSDRVRQTVSGFAGRESYGTTLIFKGDISEVRMSQPPDIWAEIRALTGQYDKGEVISIDGVPTDTIANIATQAADSLSLSLENSSIEKTVSNYQYTGSLTGQVESIQRIGGIDAFIDDEKLVVKDQKTAVSDDAILISRETGMTRIPEFTEFGVRVEFFINRVARTGALIEVESNVYPATNGQYVIDRLDFDITNRNTPFHYTAEAQRLG